MNDQQKNRLDAILSYLNMKEFASVKELAAELDVTEMTIRRDIQILKDNKIVRQLHGAVTRNPDSQFDPDSYSYSIMQTKSIREQEKERIGKEAVKLIRAKDTVFIDIGTTAAALAKAIPLNLDITAGCFSTNIFSELVKKKIKDIFLSGGFYHRDTEAFESDEAVNALERMRANTAFIAPSGISMEMGLTAMTPYEAKIKSAMIANAEKRVLIADSSKFSEVRPCFISSFDRINTVITDKGISDEWIEFFNKRNIEIRLC